MIARYVELVIARPDDESAVRRLLERASAQPGGLDALVQELALRRDREGVRIDVALAAIALGRDDAASAQRILEAILASDDAPATAYVLSARLVRAGSGAASSTRVAELLGHAVERAPDAPTREAYQRDLALALLELGRLDEVRAIYATLAQGGSSTARTELVRMLASHGHCADARADFEVAARAVASDASASVGLALLRAECERELGAPALAAQALEEAWGSALRSGRTVELLDAMVTVARESDGLAALETELAARGAVAALHRGIVLEELGREAEALEVLEDVLRRSPRDADTRQRVVRLLARNGRMEESLDEQRALARLFPDRVALTLELATALRDQGHADEALAVLDRARARARRDRTSLFLLVDAYARLGARDRVLATLEAIVRADPHDPRALVALANELLESRDAADRERALALVERVAASDDVVGHVEAARALANLRVFDRAFAHLEAAARLAPEAPEVLDAQADLFERAGRTDDAERVLARRVALASGSDDPVVREAGLDAEARLVASWDRHGALSQHRAELEARFAQGDESAGRMLAELLRRTDHRAEALATLNALSARHPDDARLVASIARLAHDRGDYDAEVTALRRLSELEPARAGWHLSRLVELALATYHDEDAVRFADEASRRSVGDAELFVRLGRLHARRRDPERAARDYTRALEIDPDAHEAAWELAAIEREQGHARRATELLLSILERSRDDDLRERAGRAVLETARADGSEAALEPRLLALALAHGDAPVFRRLALGLYGSLSGAARARGDTAELERWVSRALPVLLAGLRDPDVGTRASARQLLFGSPVRGAAPALLALALDESVEAPARIDALAAGLRVVGPGDETQLLALLEGPSETLAILALHGLVRVLPHTPRGAADRGRLLAEHRRGPGRLADHAWALSLLDDARTTARSPRTTTTAPSTPSTLSTPSTPSAPSTPSTPSSPSSGTAPWLAAWFAAEDDHAAPSTPLRELLARQAAARGRDEAALATTVELAASGELEDALLDELARRALGARDGHARLAERVLTSRATPSLACAPVIGRNDSLEGWLGRVISACPRVPRDSDRVAAALVRTIGALDEREVPRAIEVVAAQASGTTWAPVIDRVAMALAARVLPVGATTAEVARSLVTLAARVPAILPPTAWQALLAHDDPTLRALAADTAPMPQLTDAMLLACQDPEWTVRRAALRRLATVADRALVAPRIAEALHDEAAFVRSAALDVVTAWGEAGLCQQAAELASDPDPSVAARARSLTADGCSGRMR